MPSHIVGAELRSLGTEYGGNLCDTPALRMDVRVDPGPVDHVADPAVLDPETMGACRSQRAVQVGERQVVDRPRDMRPQVVRTQPWNVCGKDVGKRADLCATRAHERVDSAAAVQVVNGPLGNLDPNGRAVSDPALDLGEREFIDGTEHEPLQVEGAKLRDRGAELVTKGLGA